MDQAKIDTLASNLLGRQIRGWLVQGFINSGKSAAVFKAEKNGCTAALKVFDTDIIEKYGDSQQLSRINRELDLVGRKHENVVEIYDGGHDAALNIYFIIMQFIDGPNLKEALKSLPPADRWPLIPQLARAAMWLEEQGLAHRDIKPENIAILANSARLVLLDLGVVRPLKGSTLTDLDGIGPFIGTLQYSSPEFLLRQERRTVEGYRALTFYQIGAVLHDLIMNKPIFEAFETPYAKLVMAVQFERPEINNSLAPTHLLNLARRCLTKNPETRGTIVAWEQFLMDPLHLDTAPVQARVLETLTSLRATQNESTLPASRPAPISNSDLTAILSSMKASARMIRTKAGGIPPMSQQKIAPGKVGTIFVIAKGQGPVLSEGMRIYVAIKLVDPAEGVLRASGMATISQELSEAEIENDLEDWYLDAYRSVDFNQSFENFLFRCLDWGLCHDTANSSVMPKYKKELKNE